MAQVAIPLAVGFATSVLSALLTPTQKQKGPRLETGVPKSEYGYAIADIYGRVRIQGCLCHWGLDLKEVKKKKKKGGKGGGVVTETYSYYLTAAFLIGSEVTSIEKVWCNGVQVFEVGSSKDISERFEDFTEFHLGTGSQSVSPTIDAEVTGVIPAFRYRSYLVFNQYPIKDFDGNGYPKVDVEVLGKFGDNPKVKDIVADICEKAGLDSVDYSVGQIPESLTTTGIKLRNDGGSYADVLIDLQRIYFLITKEVEGVIYFFPQKTTQITADFGSEDLAAREFSTQKTIDRYIQKISHARELPSEVQIEFTNKTNNFDTGMQYARNPSATHDNPLSIKTEVVSTDSAIASVASQVLYQSQIQRYKYQKISLLPAWKIEVGDIALLPIDGLKIPVQVSKKSFGANYLTELEAIRYGTAYFVDTEATPETEIICRIIVSWRRISDSVVLNTRYWDYRKTVPYLVDSVVGVGTSTWTPVLDFYSFFGFHLGQLSVEDTEGNTNLINAGSNFADTSNSSALLQAITEGIAKDPGEASHQLFGTFAATFGINCEARVDSVTILSVAELGGLGGGVFNYTQDVEPEYNPAVIPDVGTATAIALDIPLVNDSDDDIGVYVAIEGDSNWRDGVLYVSLDAGVSYQAALQLTANSVTGIVSEAIASASTTVPDTTNSFTLTIGGTGAETVEPVTDSEFSQGFQVALVGNEIIWFRDVVQTGTNPNVYTISHLMRGRRGTESFTTGHTTNERFILLSDYLERLPGRAIDLGSTIRIKAVGGGNAETDVTPYTSITLVGNSLKPYSPVNAIATKDNAGNIYLGWTRRDRHAGDRNDYSTFPLSETTESYEIDIMNGVTVARTLTATSPSVTYLVADQITDFGSVQSSVTIKVYQISSLYGRGFALTASLTPTLSPITPTISGFSPTQGDVGDTITVFGTGFTGATAIAINGTSVTGLTVVSDTEANGVIDTGTISGLVTITTAGGTGTSPTTFVIGAGYTDEQAVDAVAAALTDSETISWSYDDINNAIAANIKDASIYASKLNSFSLEAFIYGLGIQGYTDEQVDDRVVSLLQAGTNITFVYDDPANTLTINSTGGGGGGGSGGSGGGTSVSSLDTDLALYFPFDGNLTDTKINATLVPSLTTTGFTYPSGKIGTGLASDGDGIASVDVGATFQINRQTPFSFAFWVNLADFTAANTRSFCGLRTSTGLDVCFCVKDSNNNLNFTIVNSAGGVMFTNASLVGLVSAGVWFHVVVTYNPGVGSVVYINGIPRAVNNSSKDSSFRSFPDNQCILRIFNPITANNFAGDALDELGFWRRTLSPWEVIELYNSGNGKRPSPINIVNGSGLFEYYNFY